MTKQTQIRDVRLEQAGRGDWASAADWGEPDVIWEHVHRDTNLVRAIERLDWRTLCPVGATVLDLGCGSGWLSALLSKQSNVERIIAWDRSPQLLTDALPRVFELIGGEASKLDAVCGDFTPLLLDDQSIDLTVMSSAFHHAPDPHTLLEELRRTLSPEGTVMLLNETPWHPLGMLGFATRMYAATVANLLRGEFRRAGHLGAEHALYDDALGDRAYTLRTWRRMIARGGFSVEILDTGMPSYPPQTRPRGRLESNLFHFVLRHR
jgi:ubiquinone/menaquinone biosynthesis C-methylase UbiE